MRGAWFLVGVLALAGRAGAGVREGETCFGALREIQRELESGRVDEAWERIGEWRAACEVRTFDLLALGYRLDRCGAEERAAELYAHVAAHASDARDVASARIKLADRLARAGTIEPALAAYRAIGCERPGVASRVACLELRRSRPHAAVAAWERAARSSRSVTVRDGLVQALRAAGRTAAALEVLRGEWAPARGGGCLAPADDPLAGDASRRAALLRELGRADEAREELRPWLGTSRAARRAWVEVAFAEGRGAEALEVLTEADADEDLARFLRLLEARAAGDAAALARAARRDGPHAAWALEALAALPGAAAWARAELGPPDEPGDGVPLAVLVATRTGDALPALQARLALAAAGRRGDGPCLLTLLAALEAPGAAGALRAWTDDPVLGRDAWVVLNERAPYRPWGVSGLPSWWDLRHPARAP